MNRIDCTIDLGGPFVLRAQVMGAGPPLVFLHGLACGWRSWRGQMIRLARSHRCIAFDFPGHGPDGGSADAASDPARYSETAFVDAAVGVLDTLGIARAALVGHSMGGGIALEFAIRHPHRVSALLAADAGSGSDDPTAYRARAAELADLVESRGVDAYADALLASPTMRDYADRSARTRRHLRLLVLRNHAAGLARVIRGVNLRRPAMHERALERIICPTVIVNGALDRACLASGRAAAGRIASARYVEVPDAGHMLPLEAPDTFARMVHALTAAAAATG